MSIPHLVLIATLIVGILISYLEAFGIPSSVAITPLATTGEALVCAIVLKDTTRSVECSTISAAAVGAGFPLFPTISFTSLSGGHDLLCGLELDGTSFFCWKQTSNHNSSWTRVYHNGTVPLRDLVVGESQVVASDQNGTFTQWWFAGRDFPARFPGNFRSHTSGADFTCAVNNDNNSTKCWSPRGRQIQAAFADQTMSTMLAGHFSACGVADDGRLLCSGRDFRQPSFEFESLALGSNHTCVLRSSNGTVVCWGAGGDEYSLAKNLSFGLLVASGNIFCGLTKVKFNIHCWWTNRSPSLTLELPLHSVVPGICAKESSCQCGVLPGSSNYCSNSSVVCEPCTSRPPSSHRSSLSEASIEWIVLACVAFALALLCVWVCRGESARAQNRQTRTTY